MMSGLTTMQICLLGSKNNSAGERSGDGSAQPVPRLRWFATAACPPAYVLGRLSSCLATWLAATRFLFVRGQHRPLCASSVRPTYAVTLCCILLFLCDVLQTGLPCQCDADRENCLQENAEADGGNGTHGAHHWQFLWCLCRIQFMNCMSPLLLLLLRQGDDEFDDIDGVEEVRDLRQFILEVPLFQGMMEAEEVTILGQMPLRLACICTCKI